jgi:DNA-binding IclR family transcriptional regulator
MPAKPRPDRHIQSINVGFKLLQYLVESPHPLSLKELAQRSGMQSGHAFLYMASFLKVGVVRQNQETSRYDLGPFALNLGLAAMRRTDVVELAREPMYVLGSRTHQSVYLSVWGNRGPTMVAKVDAPQGSALQLAVGFVNSLLETSTGRLFLAFLPRGQTQALVAHELATGPQILKDAMTARDVDAVVERTLKAGFSTSDERRDDGYASVSAPIFDHASAIRATISLTGPRGAFERNADEYREAVLEGAARVSESLGRRVVRPPE